MPAVRPVHLSVSFLLSRHHSLLYDFIVCGVAAASSSSSSCFLQSYNLFHALHVAQLLYQLFQF